MAKAIKSNSRGEAKKPYEGFPMFPHQSGRWAKKCKGRFLYFGPTAGDPDGKKALERFNREWSYLKDGKTPPPLEEPDGLTVKKLVNAYLTEKEVRRDAGEITDRTFRDAYTAAERIVTAFGRWRAVSDLTPDDFRALRKSLALTLGPLALGIEIQRIRAVFKWGYENQKLRHPMTYGTAFNKPSRKAIREAAQKREPRLFTPTELRSIIDDAGVPLRAMILLAINCGMGNRDIALLPMKAVDLDTGWLDYPRPKTAVDRRCPLWPKTIEAIRSALEERREPKDPAHADLLFVTRQGECYVQSSNGEKGAWKDGVGLAFGKLLRKLDLKRPGVNFYALRHCHRTAADEAKDQAACDVIMGHAADSSDMAAVYRHGVSDERLRAVVAVVHRWLFDNGGAA